MARPASQEIIPLEDDVFSESSIGRRAQLVVKPLSNIAFPSKELLLAEDVESNGWKLAFLHFHSEDEAADG